MSKRIISLEAERIRRIKAVSIHLDPAQGAGPVFLTGKNDAGKSTAIDCILMALCGGKIDDPIRSGEEQGEIRIAIGDKEVDLTVRKVFKQGQPPRLIVKAANGMTGGQAALDSLIGAIGIDPVQIANMDPVAQATAVLEALGVDNSDLDAEAAEAYQKRRDKNVEAKTCQARMDAINVDPETPEKPVNVQELLARLERLQAVNAENQRKRESREDLMLDLRASAEALMEKAEVLGDIDGRIQALQEQKAKIRKEQQNLQEAHAAQDQMLQELDAEVETLEDVDTADVRSQIDQAETINDAVRQRREKERLQVEIDKAKEESQQLTDRLAAITEAKRKRAKEAGLPESLEGLDFTDAGLTFEGFPLAKLGTGKRLRVATQLAVAMNPNLRVVLIKAGNDLDNDNLRTIVDAAEEAGAQVWMETVLKRDVKGDFIEIVDGTAEYGAGLTKAWDPAEPGADRTVTEVVEQEIEQAGKAVKTKKAAKAESKKKTTNADLIKEQMAKEGRLL